MKQLWAPWRMQFIEELKGSYEGCIFCDIKEGGNDRDRLILHRGRSCYVLMNRYPYNSGHLLIIPYKHTGELSLLSHEEYAELMALCSRSVKVLGDALNAEGYNCGINLGKVAGAGVEDHVHMHVVPRWCGDTNFMPVLADTTSMPEYLTETYDKLLGGFKGD